MDMLKKIRKVVNDIWRSFMISIPDECSKYRVRYYNRMGCHIHPSVSISSNVRIRGKFEMDEGSSIAQNCTISGESAGVFIGKNVMIAPNVVLVAFNHGYQDTTKAMVFQTFEEDSIIIEDDVWIASNCSIGKGVRIGQGSIIGANSFVNKDVPPFSIMGGVPAKLIKSRI